LAKPTKVSMSNLNSMSLAELKSLEKKVARAIAKFEELEKKQALVALKAQAKKLGFSLSELTGAVAKPAKQQKPRKKVPPKYANPADKSQTWTGRGRRPVWVVEALEAGRTLDDLEIKSGTPAA